MENEKTFVRFLIARKGLQPVTVSGYAGAMKRITREIGQYPSEESAEQFVEKIYTSGYSYHHKLNTVLALEQYLAFIGRPTRYGRPKKPRPIVTDTLTERPRAEIACALGRSPVRVRSRKRLPSTGRQLRQRDASSLKTQSGLFAARASKTVFQR
ncbi:MAG: hypothetical protein AAB480_01970 [Patescibacteria group bacterium]